MSLLDAFLEEDLLRSEINDWLALPTREGRQGKGSESGTLWKASLPPVFANTAPGAYYKRRRVGTPGLQPPAFYGSFCRPRVLTRRGKGLGKDTMRSN